METHSQSVKKYVEQAFQLLRSGKDSDSVLQSLMGAGAASDEAASILKQAKSLIYLKRRKRGFMLGIAGSALLILGFILTVIFYHSGISIHAVMYGMTSLGVILLIVGMIEVLGW